MNTPAAEKMPESGLMPPTHAKSMPQLLTPPPDQTTFNCADNAACSTTSATAGDDADAAGHTDLKGPTISLGIRGLISYGQTLRRRQSERVLIDHARRTPPASPPLSKSESSSSCNESRTQDDSSATSSHWDILRSGSSVSCNRDASRQYYTLHDTGALAAAIERISKRRLPDTNSVFPWMYHHPSVLPGVEKREIFYSRSWSRRKSGTTKIPRRSSLSHLGPVVQRQLRGIILVKAGGNLTTSCLKGSVAPSEILQCSSGANSQSQMHCDGSFANANQDGEESIDGPASRVTHENHEIKETELIDNFLDTDLDQQFSIRNFDRQLAQMAKLSDIVVYRDQDISLEQSKKLAEKLACAQHSEYAQNLRKAKLEGFGPADPPPSTFLLNDAFPMVEEQYPELVGIDRAGKHIDPQHDFAEMERRENQDFARPWQICHNVWTGCSLDPEHELPFTTIHDGSVKLPPSHVQPYAHAKKSGPEAGPFDILLEAGDDIDAITETLLLEVTEKSLSQPQTIRIPSSGSMLRSSAFQTEPHPLLTLCQWTHLVATGEPIPELATESIPGDTTSHDSQCSTVTRLSKKAAIRSLGAQFRKNPPSKETRRLRKVFLHCGDGYTETTLFMLAYYMYAKQCPLHSAIVELHKQEKREFFAYDSDIRLLLALEDKLVPRLHNASTGQSASRNFLTAASPNRSIVAERTPNWLENMDGSLPSRILPYMYLGNLTHANNPDLLSELGIGQILSVGEPTAWTAKQMREWTRLHPKQSMLSIEDVLDNGSDSLRGQIDRCLEFIRNGRHANTATLVHCRVGVSRSATICIAEVMSSLHYNFAQAYTLVRARRLNVIIQPHLRFVHELLKWEEECQLRLLRNESLQSIHEGKARTIWRHHEWVTVCREIARLNAAYQK